MRINTKKNRQLTIENSKIEFNHKKWFKKVLEGEITVDEVVYTLKTTTNKRRPIIFNDGYVTFNCNTEPYNYDEF